MAEYHYNSGERARRRKRREAQRRRKVIILSVVTVLVLIAGIALGLSMCGRGEDEPDETPSGNMDPQGGEAGNQQDPENQVIPGGEDVSDNPDDPDEGQGEQMTAKIPWNLVLVNPWNKMEEGYVPELKTLDNGMEIDERCYDDLMDMLDAVYDEGLTPVVCSAYRTQELQEELFDGQVTYFLNQGMSKDEAKKAAAKEVAVPGTSEHQLGLAVDIVDVTYQLLDEGQENTAVQQWLMENSWRYGFILRYPTDKTEITGIIYEPWHYRYVGREYAKEIYDSGLCLEEWLEQKYEG